MSPQERSEIVQVLEDSRQVFSEAAAGLSDAQATTSPAEGRWSVLQCIEHVTFVEGRFLGFLEQAGRLESPVIDPKKEGDLLARVADRTARAESPEMARPMGKFANLTDAMAAFHAARSRTVAYVTERAAELHTLACQHPRFGPMNGRELCMVIAGHARRHAAQIREVRSAL